MDALENVLLDGAGKRVVVAEEESLGEIDHVEETQTMILEVLGVKSPRKLKTSSSLLRERRDLSLFLEEGSILSGITSEFYLEFDCVSYSDGVDHMTHDDSFGFGFGDNHKVIATNESDKA